MEIPLEKFFQIFSHGRLAAFDGMANGALVHALLPGNLAVALAEDQMRLYPDALHLWQRVEGIPQVDEQLHTIQKLLRRRLMQTGRVFDPIVTVEGILRLIAGRAPLMGCLIQLVRLQLGGHFVGNFDVFVMGVPSVKVLQIDATRSYFASADEQWRKLLDHLKGKEITSAGHLSAQNFSFGEEIIELDGKLNFYLQADFDVDAAFGTFVCADQNDDWLNIYANYDVEQERLCDTLELNLCKGDGSEESWSYPLNAAEQEVLLRKMEAFCQQQTGMSLHEYARQLRDSEKQAPEMQM